MTLSQHSILERTYAGVLGKIIGVYLGRPFEGWHYDRIMANLGEIAYYVHERFNAPLVLTDDDISGTFTFPRALADYGYPRDLTSKQIGQTWLNYIVEDRTTLSWAGLGNSTEHTAYLRLKRGIPAPESGSIAVNTRMVAEQIGAQIFIDGWAMVAPGDPDLAAYLAGQAASVSHDGVALHAAQVIAAVEALAYVESDLVKLIDTALRFIPSDSIICRLIDDLREWHEVIPDWHDARARLADSYGYQIYRGGVHIVPNHGVVMLSLLYGGDDFQKALLIANTSGWDTDCNSGNVGCILGIKNGLAGLNSGPDYRTHIADRLYLPSADGASAITDAVNEALHLVNTGRALAGQSPVVLKGGERFHFDLPGAVQGFAPNPDGETGSVVTLENVAGHSETGLRSLAIYYRHVAQHIPARVATPTFIPPEDMHMPGYGLHASPTLYPGQTVQARVEADTANESAVELRLYMQAYGVRDTSILHRSPGIRLAPGQSARLAWCIPETSGWPIYRVGIEINAIGEAAVAGTLYLDWLTWDGVPDVVFRRPEGEPPGNWGVVASTMWRRAWVSSVDSFDAWWPEAFRLVQNEGTGMLIQGTSDWKDYSVSAEVSPHMLESGGIAVRVQGLRRWYGLLLEAGGRVRLVKAYDDLSTLGSMAFAWEPGNRYVLRMDVQGARIVARIDEAIVFDVEDQHNPLLSGAAALMVTEGRIATDSVAVHPLPIE